MKFCSQLLKFKLQGRLYAALCVPKPRAGSETERGAHHNVYSCTSVPLVHIRLGVSNQTG